MKIVKETKIGKVEIEIPINIGDRMDENYIIHEIIVVDENNIFAVNRSSGLWVNLDNLEFVKERNDIKYFKQIRPEKD